VNTLTIHEETGILRFSTAGLQWVQPGGRLLGLRVACYYKPLPRQPKSKIQENNRNLNETAKDWHFTQKTI
jgi:hypothetical protein